jgi:hypothetical protein
MNALLERVASDQFLEGLVVTIREWTATGSGMRLILGLAAADSLVGEQWVVECESVRACRVSWGLAYHVEHLTDHVLLAPYLEPNVTLAIRGPVRDARHAIADLWQAHHELAGDWFPLTAFLNDGMPLAELLQSSGAICAAGPSRFIAAYQSALAKNGTDAYTPWERSPKVWRDGSWQEESHNTSLLLLKPHFIVGTGFSARRIA